ncbi:hypothetical protein D3C86_1963610 [compost metagenome]
MWSPIDNQRFASARAALPPISASGRFCRKTMSVVTSVPAFLANALLGRRIAPRNTVRSLMYFRAASAFASRNELVTTCASTPPSRSMSTAFAKK